jgi:acyl-CoA dehydrogenase
VHAACGLYPDRPVERYLRDAHHIFAPAGTSDIQLLRLSEVALGKGKGQWSERLAEPVEIEETSGEAETSATRDA